jgi:hypothetical protein
VAARDVVALHEHLGETKGTDERPDVDDDQGESHDAEVAGRQQLREHDLDGEANHLLRALVERTPAETGGGPWAQLVGGRARTALVGAVGAVRRRERWTLVSRAHHCPSPAAGHLPPSRGAP